MSLTGVIGLDYQDALADLKIWRRELKNATQDSTKVKIDVDYNGAKVIRQLRNDFQTFTKIGKEHKVAIVATAEGAQAIKTVREVKTELGELGKNPRVVIHIDDKSARESSARIVADAKKAEKEIASFGKALESDVSRTGKATSNSLDAEINKMLKQSEAAFKKAQKADEDAGKAMLRQQKADGAAIAREIEAGYRRRGVSINRYGEEVRTVTGYLKQLTDEEKKAAAARERSISAGKEAASRVGDRAATGASVVGVGILAGLGAATSKAIAFEDSFADVRKTVSGTEDELDKLGGALLRMEGKIPVGVQELDSIAANAGQLGIEGSANVLKFTRTVADLSRVTKLTSDEAGENMAKFGNITRMPQAEYGRLGSTIAKLGNIGASSEKQLLDMGLRIAGAGHEVGMTEPQILGVANALSSLGIEAEAGGSAFSRSLIEISKASSTNSKELKTFAAVAGMTTRDFKRLFDENATEAVTRFVEGLGKLKKGDIFRVLDELGLKSIRVEDTLSRASGAGDLMRKSVEAGSKAWEQNTFLTEKAEARYKTHANQIKITQGRIDSLAVGVGEKLLPVEEKLLGVVDNLLGRFEGYSDSTQTNIIKTGLFAGVVLTTIKPLHDLGEMAGDVRKAYIGMRDAQLAAEVAGAASSKSMVVGLSNVLIGTRAASSGFWTLRVAGIGGLGAVGIAIGSLVAIFYGLRNTIIGTADAGSMSADRLRQKWGPLGDIWDGLSIKANNFANQLVGIVNNPAFRIITAPLGGEGIRLGVNALTTSDPVGDAAEKKSMSIVRFSKWKREHAAGPQPLQYATGGKSSGADPYGDPENPMSKAPPYIPGLGGASGSGRKMRRDPANFGFAPKPLVAPTPKELAPFDVTKLLAKQEADDARKAKADQKAYLASVTKEFQAVMKSRFGTKKTQSKNASAESEIVSDYYASEKKKQDEINDTTDAVAKLNDEYRANVDLTARISFINKNFGAGSDDAERAIARIQETIKLWHSPELQKMIGMENKGLLPHGTAHNAFDEMIGNYDIAEQIKANDKLITEAKKAQDEVDKSLRESRQSEIESVNDSAKRIQAALANSNSSAQDLRDTLDEIPDILKALASMGMDQTGFLGPNWNKFATGLDKLKAEIPKRQDSETLNAYGLDDTKNEIATLKKQLADAQLAHRKPLTPLQIQANEWRVADATIEARSGKPSDTVSAAIKKERDSVRSLLGDIQELGKVERAVDRIGSAFDTMFDSVISGQKSFLGALRDGFQSTLQDIASDIIKSQFRSLLYDVLGSSFSGAGGKKAAPAKADGSHASGLDSVPFDNYRANLHKSEMVLSAVQAERYRSDRAAKLAGQRIGSTQKSTGGSTTVIYQHNGNIITNDPVDYQRQQQEQARRNGPRRSRFENSRRVGLVAVEAKF